jgi:hypothetical protein
LDLWWSGEPLLLWGGRPTIDRNLHQKPDFCLRFAPNRIISILGRRLSLVLW